MVFLGRLVSDKGVDLLISAISFLKEKNLFPTLSIIGIGEDEQKLKKLTIDLDLEGQITFLGLKKGEELVNILNQHEIMVIPSIWSEPFGIVALEGIACGCVIVGSENGGLKEAIGSCGVTFPNGDIRALTEILFNLITDKINLSKYTSNAQEHLLMHERKYISQKYIDIFEKHLKINAKYKPHPHSI